MIRWCDWCEKAVKVYRNDQIWSGRIIETYFCDECDRKIEK